MTDRYPKEDINAGRDYECDNGTMQVNVDELAEAVIGHRIVSFERNAIPDDRYGYGRGHVLTLDNGTRVELIDSDDCCAYTEMAGFLAHPEMVDHIITGVGTTDGFNTWHIYADMGDMLKLDVEWSSGNPFYYAYGFHIKVRPVNA